MLSVLLDGCGVYEFSRIPSIGEMIDVDNNLLLVKEVIHFCQPILHENGKQIFGRVRVSSTSQPIEVPPITLSKSIRLSSRDDCLSTLKRKLGVKQPNIVKSEFRGDSWQFTIQNGSPVEETYNIRIKDFQISRDS